MNKIEIKNDEKLTRQEREIYRSLRMNLEFTGVENRAIVVTSCTPNEGKSTVSYNLAVALAAAGKKTILIDGDMRRSELIDRYQIEGVEKGLSHFLSGQSAMNEILYATEKKNLLIIPTGVFPKNPTELITNGRLEKLIGNLKEVVDYIIIDTPPLANVIDAAAFASVCDGTILVIAANENSKSIVQGVVKQIQKSNPNIIGTVLNKAPITKQGYYYSSYY